MQERLAKLPPAKKRSEKAVVRHAKGFGESTNTLRRDLTRWLIDKRPARASLAALNKHAWDMHRHLDRAPVYRAIWGDWARVVSILRKLNREMIPKR